MSENKKLTQLPEKLTSLDPNDLLYVSANGVSKSVKASVIEAPLKTYADTKASEAQATAISAANSTAQSLVNNEAARATSAESSLQNQITTEISNRIASDSSIQSSINVESSRAVAAESSLQNQISQEVSDRQALASRVSSLEVDPVTKNYVDSEVSDIQLQISALLSNIDPVALDSFTEVVSAFQTADSNLSGTITTLTNTLTNNLNAEITSRQSAISSEQSSRISADSSLQSQISQEISARVAGDQSLEDSLDSEVSRALSVESSLQSQISQEISDRQAAISQEVSDRNNAIYNATTGHIIPRETLVYDLGSPDYRFKDLYLSGNTIILGETTISSNEDGELDLQEGATVGGSLIATTNYVDSAVDLEESRALAAEASLGQRIDNVLSNIDPASLDSLTELVAAFEAADDSLSGAITTLTTTTTNNLNAEITSRQAAVSTEQSARISADSSLQSQITSEQSARSAGDSSTLASAQSHTNSVAAALVPAGVISMYAGTTAPSGYLLCDGSAVSRSTYSALFAVISTSFGVGNGSTTFNLPNPDSNANIRLIIKI